MTQEIRNESRRRERERADAAARRRQFAADIKALAARPEGRRLVAWLIRRGGIFSEGVPAEPTAAAYAAGHRAMAVELWNMLRRTLAPGAFAAVALESEGGAHQPPAEQSEPTGQTEPTGSDVGEA